MILVWTQEIHVKFLLGIRKTIFDPCTVPRKSYMTLVRLRGSHKWTLYYGEEFLNYPGMALGVNMEVVRLRKICIWLLCNCDDIKKISVGLSGLGTFIENKVTYYLTNIYNLVWLPGKLKINISSFRWLCLFFLMIELGSWYSRSCLQLQYFFVRN